MQLIVAEKPSVARDLARVLGVKPSGKTAFEGDRCVITWCVGHLVELDEPASYDPRWKAWRLDTLPMLPERFKLRPSTHAPEQYRAVRALLTDKRFHEVVNACDAGREGELIFRYVYDLAKSRLPMRRLWVSSLTDEAIRAGFAQLRPGAQYDALADAARCRSEADWLVGLNATRAFTARSRARGRANDTLYSIGRVQTPTLALLVAREKAIRDFVPQDYWELRATLSTAAADAGNGPAKFTATWRHEKRTRLASAPLAEQLTARCRAHARAADPLGPVVETVRTRTVREAAPLLFDLTSLQRTANRRYGMSAARTLEVAQRLYEQHKAVTYPRTDSRHLSRDVADELPRLFTALQALSEYKPFAAHLTAHPPAISKRVFDDARVTDHHAIIPTGKPVRLEALDPEERKLFDLIVRRFLGVFYPDAEFAQTEVVVRVGADAGRRERADGASGDEPARAAAAPPRGASVAAGAPRGPSGDVPGARAEEPQPMVTELPPPPDRFFARGRVRLRAGWQEVAGMLDDDAPSSSPSPGGDPSSATALLPALREGQRLDGAFDPLARKTQPPPRYTEATLLSAMESAGRAIEDEALRLAMKDRGLGTPATRAAIIETLLKRGYAGRDKKQLVPTPMGEALIDGLPVESLTSPELTGEWEARLSRVARGEDARDAFMADIARYVTRIVESIRGATPPPASAVDAPAGAPLGRCPRCGAGVVELRRAYACSADARPCGFEMPKIVAGRAISPALAGVLLGRRATQVLRGFRSRAGKPFSAALVLGDDGALTFDFGRGASRDGDAAPPPTAHGAAPDAGAHVPPSLVASRRPRAAARAAGPAPDGAPTPRARVATAARRVAAAKPPAPAPAANVADLACPRCAQGTLITGKRGWGCSRWREGCGFVVWFEAAGKRLTESLLRELIARGKTRKARFQPGNGPPVRGRLVLDPRARDGAVRFEADGGTDDAAA